MDTSIPLARRVNTTPLLRMQPLHLGGMPASQSRQRTFHFHPTHGAESGTCNTPNARLVSADWSDGQPPEQCPGREPTSRWITARLVTPSCLNCQRRQSRTTSAAKCVKSSNAYFRANGSLIMTWWKSIRSSGFSILTQLLIDWIATRSSQPYRFCPPCP